LPVPDGWADVVISNGVLNLTPDKRKALQEMARVLKPGGRLQVGDILVQTPVPDDAKRDIDLLMRLAQMLLTGPAVGKATSGLPPSPPNSRTPQHALAHWHHRIHGKSSTASNRRAGAAH
jgi:ubiquinone/menaquinone biosynthesis C-methylase UbiE